MSSIELELSVLSPLCFYHPEWLELVDLRDTDFSAGHCRETFTLITKHKEESPGKTIDPTILQQHLGGNGSGAFVGSLFDGRPAGAPETFIMRATELRQQRLREQLKRIATKPDDESFEKVRTLLDQHDALNRPRTTDPILGNLGEVEAEPVSWLWEPYFPAGKLIGLGGDPDMGKTWFALQIAACLSRGLPWPNGARNEIVGSTVYLSGEDEPGDVLRPRIDWLGGDPRKVFYLRLDTLDLSSPETINRLESEILKIGDCRMLVLDPAFDFTGRVNPNAVEQARAFLGPVKTMAKRQSVSVLMIIHAKKGEVDRAVDWIGGSKSGWAGKFRALFGIDKCQDDPLRRIFFKIKANLAPVEPPQIAFRIVGGRLEFEAKPANVDIRDLLKRDRIEDAPQMAEAVKFLRSVLASGPVGPPEIYSQAKQAGIAQRTLERAKNRAGVESYKDGLQWKWIMKSGRGL